MYAWPNASENAAVSFDVTRRPRRRSSCPTRVVPANRSAAERTPSAAATAPITGTSVRFEPRYLITARI